jgi:hypothetical protein
MIPEVVLLDIESGAERRRLRLEWPEGGWMPASLDLDEGILLVNRWTSGELERELARPWVIDLRGDNARLARSQPQIEPSREG